MCQELRSDSKPPEAAVYHASCKKVLWRMRQELRSNSKPARRRAARRLRAADREVGLALHATAQAAHAASVAAEWDRRLNDLAVGGEPGQLAAQAALDLVELDCDLIGCPTPVWANIKEGDRPWYFNALDRKPDGYVPHEPCEGLQEVDAIGSGCFLVSRRVMEALKDQQPFARQWGDDGLVELGGDFSFSRKVKAAGFNIWAHFDYLCDHYSETPLLEVIRAFGAVREVQEVPFNGPGSHAAAR